nr:oligosaccharide flippase family protein [Methanolinea mesophila]
MNIGPVKRQSIIGLAANLGIAGIGYIATVYFAHTLGPAPLGAFYLFLAYLGVVNLLADGGMGGATVQRVSEGEDQREFFSAGVAVRLVLIPFALSVLFLARTLLIDFSSTGLFNWLFLAVVVTTSGSIIAAGNYGRGKAGVIQVAELGTTIVKVLAQVLAVYLGYSAAGLAGGFVAGAIAGIVINLRFLDIRPGRFTRKHLSSMAPYAGWVFLSAALALVISSADTILVGYFLTTEEVGFYRTSFQLTTLALFIVTTLTTALYPRISRWYREGELATIGESVGRAYSYSLLLAIPVSAGGIILADRLLYFLYGSPFTVAAAALSLLFLVQLASIFPLIDSMCLGALNRPRTAFVINAINAVLVVILEVALIPLLGIAGAALAILGAMVFRAVISHHVLGKEVSIAIERGTVARILAASTVMGIAVGTFRLLVPLDSFWLLLADVILGVIIYGVLILRLDRGIHDELKDLSKGIGLPWPGWL